MNRKIGSVLNGRSLTARTRMCRQPSHVQNSKTMSHVTCVLRGHVSSTMRSAKRRNLDSCNVRAAHNLSVHSPHTAQTQLVRDILVRQTLVHVCNAPVHQMMVCASDISLTNMCVRNKVSPSCFRIICCPTVDHILDDGKYQRRLGKQMLWKQESEIAAAETNSMRCFHTSPNDQVLSA